MNTLIYQWHTDDEATIVHDAASTLKEGGLVVFPTETVYGIGANALDPDAARRIYEVKGRPSDNPLIVHIADANDLSTYAVTDHPAIAPLIQSFWPGPLTLVLPKRSIVPDAITGGLDTVAVRLPNHPLAQAIIAASGCPIAAPSANTSGTPSSTAFQHVFSDLNQKVDLIIDGGPSMVGLESTVLDLTSDVPTILRPGFVTRSMIAHVLQSDVIEGAIDEVKDIPRSPGMKYRHYAPKGYVELLEGTPDKLISFLHQQPPSFAVIASHELCDALGDIPCFDLGPRDDMESIARSMFGALRAMDETGVPTIYIEAFEPSELGVAIMNRLIKAASGHVRRL
jgi:L-threonylcarbamoyladenylate synthase